MYKVLEREFIEANVPPSGRGRQRPGVRSNFRHRHIG